MLTFEYDGGVFALGDDGQDEAGLEEVGDVTEGDGHSGVDHLNHVCQLKAGTDRGAIHLRKQDVEKV